MGKKNQVEKQRSREENQANGSKKQDETEGKFLLGKPKFKKLDNGSSRLICKLTGHAVNKTEEHIWKHINGKRFLNMLEKEEAEGKSGKEASDGITEEEKEDPEKAVKRERDNGLKEKKKEKNVSKMTSEVKGSEANNGDAEETDFWVPPLGERWDFDDGKDRWGSGSESDSDPETDDACKADAADKESINNSVELHSTKKRTSVETEPSDFGSSKKKKTRPT